MSKLLLKNAVLATPERIIRNDLLIEDKIITKIDRDISCDDAKVIDCHEYVVLLVSLMSMYISDSQVWSKKLLSTQSHELLF